MHVECCDCFLCFDGTFPELAPVDATRPMISRSADPRRFMGYSFGLGVGCSLQLSLRTPSMSVHVMYHQVSARILCKSWTPTAVPDVESLHASCGAEAFFSCAVSQRVSSWEGPSASCRRPVHLSFMSCATQLPYKQIPPGLRTCAGGWNRPSPQGEAGLGGGDTEEAEA